MTTPQHRVLDAASLPTLPLRGELSADVDYVFSDRSDGSMSSLVGDGDHARWRGALASSVGLTPTAVTWMHQVHGADVADAAGADVLSAPTCDGIIETRPDHAVAVMVADCVPVLLATTEGVAAAHAGREGLLAGVVETTVATLRHATGTDEVSAVIGPAIGGCCYEVGEAMAADVEARLPGTRTETTWGTPSLDLVAGVHRSLVAVGVRDVSRAGACTRCGGDARWFSHRASGGDERRPAGRQAGMVLRRTGERR